MTERKKRYHYTERVPLIAKELRRLNRPATRAELYEALKTGSDGLFRDRRRVDATIRDNLNGPQLIFERHGRNLVALREPFGHAEQAPPGRAESRVYERGQTVVPKKIRDALGVEQGSTLVWEIQDGTARVIAIPKDPVGALRGILKGKGPTFEQFLADRNAERQRERELESDEERRWRTYSTRQH